MTDTTARCPETPAEVAAAVLDAIEHRPDVFDMHNWVRLPDRDELRPTAEPSCGTKLCAAGWAAHLTGWTLVDLGEEDYADVTVRDDDGTESLITCSVFAEKGAERRLIDHVAADALDLTPDETFWYGDGPTAIARLQEIAGR